MTGKWEKELIFFFYVKIVTKRMNLLLSFLSQVGATFQNLSARKKEEENSPARFQTQLGVSVRQRVQQQLASKLLGPNHRGSALTGHVIQTLFQYYRITSVLLYTISPQNFPAICFPLKSENS